MVKIKNEDTVRWPISDLIRFDYEMRFSPAMANMDWFRMKEKKKPDFQLKKSGQLSW